MNIHFLITHSYGELDIIAPIINELRERGKCNKISIIITVKEIFLKYKNDDFYKKLFLKRNILVKFCPLVNKFNKKFNNNYANIILKNFYSFFFIIKNISVLFSNVIFYEITNQISQDFIYIILNKFLKKKFCIYHHGHSLNVFNKNNNLRPAIPKNYFFF